MSHVTSSQHSAQKQPRLTSSAALTLFALAAPSLVQAASRPNEQVLPEVEVSATAASTGSKDNYAPAVTELGSKTPTAIRDIPQSLSVISKDVLTAQGVTSLSDALSNVPGITLSAGEGGVIGDNINLRGYSARSDLFVDGLRDQGQYARDTFFVESVEVLKGPSSMLFGRGSTGGVINRTSKKAKLQDITDVSVTIGTEDYYRSTLDFNRAIADDAAFRISLMTDSRGSQRDQIESENYGIAPTIRFGIGQDTEYSLSAVLQKTNSLPDYGLPVIDGKPADVNRDNFYGLTDDKFNTDSSLLKFGFKHRYSDNVTLTNNLNYSQVDVDAAPTPSPAASYYANGDFSQKPIAVSTATVLPAGSVRLPANTPAAWINVSRNRRDREVTQKSIYNQTDFAIKFTTGAFKHELSTGIELGHDDYENQSYAWTGLPTTNLLNPSYQSTPDSAKRTPDTLVETGANSFAAYVNEQLALNSEWKLIGGVRWERFKAGSDSTTNKGVVTPLNSDNRMLSTRLGALYQPDESQSYYASYGTSFNPSAENMTLSTANQSVDPEKSISHEVGAKWDLLAGDLSLTTSLYQVEKVNARTTDANDIITLEGNNRVRGFELGVAGKLSDVWQVIGGYSQMQSDILAAKEANTQGKELANTPKNTLSLWTTYQLAQVWEVGGGLVSSSDRFLNNTNTATIEGYTRFDATVAYRQKSYDLRLNLKNLSDEEYFDVASASRATPANGRSAQVNLNYRF